MSSEWWRGAVIYQVYPRSFMDANGDGIGDLAGITEKMDYIASLGVDAVWISPFFKSPMKDFGYDVSNYREVDPIFGDLKDFAALTAKAHNLGLKVMIDQVLSHTSDQHPWFKESRSSRLSEKADWYVWADAQPDGSAPNNWLSVFGGSSWTWDSRRKQYYLHNFLAEQPDLNYHNPEVQSQILDEVRFWLDMGVDGFRFDTANYFHHDKELRSNPPVCEQLNHDKLPANPYELQKHVYDKNRPENLPFFEKLRALLDEYGASSVGEVGDADALQTMIDYTSGSNRLHMTYSFNFLNEEGHASHVREQVQGFERACLEQEADSWPCWTIGNHDVIRVLSRWRGQSDPRAFTKMVMAMLFSLRGSACWYQGDEWMLPEADLPFEALQDPPGIAFWPEYKGRDGCRTPLPWDSRQPHAGFSANHNSKPWLPVVQEHAVRALDVQEADVQAPIHFMREFLRWRRQQPALLVGDVQYLEGGKEILAFWREVAAEAKHRLLCAFNFTAEEQAMPCPLGVTLAPVVLAGLPRSQAGWTSGESLVLPAWGIYIGQVQE